MACSPYATDGSQLTGEVEAALSCLPHLACVYDQRWVCRELGRGCELWQYHPVVLLALDREDGPGELSWRERALGVLAAHQLEIGRRLLGNLRGNDLPNWCSAWSELRVRAWMAQAGVCVTSFDKKGRADLEVAVGAEEARISIKTPLASWPDALEDWLFWALDVVLGHEQSPLCIQSGVRIGLRWTRSAPRVRDECEFREHLDEIVITVATHLRSGNLTPCEVPGAGLKATFHGDPSSAHPVCLGGFPHLAGTDPDCWLARYLREKVTGPGKADQWTAQLKGAPGAKVLLIDAPRSSMAFDRLLRGGPREVAAPLAGCPNDVTAGVDAIVVCRFPGGIRLTPDVGVYWVAPGAEDRYPAALRLLRPWLQCAQPFRADDR
jgi:hypothetical protein